MTFIPGLQPILLFLNYSQNADDSKDTSLYFEIIEIGKKVVYISSVLRPFSSVYWDLNSEKYHLFNQQFYMGAPLNSDI